MGAPEGFFERSLFFERPYRCQARPSSSRSSLVLPAYVDVVNVLILRCG
jgi:hypothetical protein